MTTKRSKRSISDEEIQHRAKVLRELCFKVASQGCLQGELYKGSDGVFYFSIRDPGVTYRDSSELRPLGTQFLKFLIEDEVHKE